MYVYDVSSRRLYTSTTFSKLWAERKNGRQNFLLTNSRIFCCRFLFCKKYAAPTTTRKRNDVLAVEAKILLRGLQIFATFLQSWGLGGLSLNSLTYMVLAKMCHSFFFIEVGKLPFIGSTIRLVIEGR
jgi:hypothetical protein